MSIKALENIPSLVKGRYASAKAASALTFAASELAILRIGDVPFQLRYCPSLAKKPTASNRDDRPQPKPDPFANPDPSLLITHFTTNRSSTTPTHFLILNKFPIIPHHFILATVASKSQAQVLEEDDLWATHTCIRQWEDSAEEDIPGGPGRLFAFFNSGEHSGASQAHRHVQFLSVDDMKRDDAEGAWRLLADEAVPAGLPFACFAEDIPANVQPAQLYEMYTRLYGKALDAARGYATQYPEHLQLHATDNGDLAISYNLAMTRSRMVICPRRREGVMVQREDGTDVGFVALNGTLLGGTLMVKQEELFEVLKRDSGRLRKVLEEVGIPSGTLQGGASL